MTRFAYIFAVFCATAAVADAFASSSRSGRPSFVVLRAGGDDEGIIDKTKDKLGDAKDAVKEKAGDIKDGIKDVAGDVKDKVTGEESAGDKLEAAGDKFVDAVEKGIDEADEGTRENIRDAADDVKDAAE